MAAKKTEEVVPALRDHVAAKMDELGLSPTTFAARTGVKQQGLMPLRKGYRRQYQKRLTGPVCELFDWTPDSIQLILAGGEPRPRISPVVNSPDDLAELRARVEELEQDVGFLLARQKKAVQRAARPPRRRASDTR